MGWSWTIGKLFGIDLKIHATFVLILAWAGWGHWKQGEGVSGVIAGVLFMLAMFGCVVLHELGHALAARRYGIGTKDITLLDKMPDDPREEIVVALAGPAVNVVIAGLLFLWLQASGGWTALADLDVVRGPMVERLMVVNLFLVGFNMLPAFPMDGGRVLRGFLALRTDYVSATRTAAKVGQGMALLFGVFGMFFNPFLMFIALFVWIGAGQEAEMTQVHAVLGGVPVSRAMQTHFRTIGAEDSLDDAVQLILTGSQQDFPVVEGDAVVGVLLRADLFAALATREAKTAGQVMRSTFPVVDAGDVLEDAFKKLQECECATVPVMQDGKLVGLVTSENLGEYLMIEAARKSAALKR
jgi:Zn-dependent protease/predicted transcriptional regulator